MSDLERHLESLETRLHNFEARIDRLVCRDVFERAVVAALGGPLPPLPVKRRLPILSRLRWPAAGELFRFYFKPPRGLFDLQQYPPRPLALPAQKSSRLMGDPPSFAIVTPSFNQARFVGATIDSVLSQGYPNLAYVVQDGGSTDATKEVLAAYGDALSWMSAPDGGQTAAINAGFAKVEGDIMAYLNSDDLLLPGSLATVAQAFAQFPDVDVIYSHRMIVDEGGAEIGRWILPPHDRQAIGWADYIPQETMFWRRRVWDAIGPFDESFRYAMDWDFILRAHRAGFRFKRLPLFLGCFRVHATQKTTAINDVGMMESARLRQAHLGFVPTQAEVERAIAAYVRRHRVSNLVHHVSQQLLRV
jgi:hypothetical protein